MTTPSAASLGVAADVSRLGGRPAAFGNDKPAFPKWSFVMASYISAMSSEMGRLMIEAGDQSDRIVSAGLAAESRPCAAQLFHILAMLCKEESLETITGVENGNGCEVWRQLRRGIMPKTKRLIVDDFIGSRSQSTSFVLRTVCGSHTEVGERCQRVRGYLGRRCAGVHPHGRVAGRLG